jgi:acyl phosphate:glycerol-3-phosphate acyltransferase
MTPFLMMLAGAYLAGSVNFSILLFALLGRGDPRSRFSGNAGTANVWRQAGLGWAGLVLLLDLLRAAGLALAALYFLPGTMGPWVGLALILGNRYPCFHGFRGGKGVAAYLGFTVPIAPYAAALSALIWAGVYGLIRLPFIASFCMVAILAAGTIFAFGYNVTAITGALATVVFVYFNHRENIMNLIR